MAFRRPYPPSFGVGERNAQVILTEQDVREIREVYQAGGGGNNGGVSMRELAETHGVTKANIWRVLHLRTWTNIS